jgi:hypothetical protein
VVILETRAFTARIDDLLTQEEYRGLQVHLVGRPTVGDVIPGTGGLRKIRWGSKGRGKRGALYCPQFLRHGESWACYPLAVEEEGADGAQVRFTG